jgi:predicted acylesterase/phospholipase RssA
VLRNVFTSVGPSDIARKRSLLAAINNDGMADNRPLWEQISRYADESLLEKVGDEHAKGRILLVGTTNLDACQPVVWNMGKIAASGAPGALDLFRTILLASAAIPGAFPPTMIRVEVDGEIYEEMHVDGGASAQVFLYPPSLRGVAASLAEEMNRKVHVYIIRNSRKRASGAPVKRQTISIVSPAIRSLIHTQGFGDLYRIYGTTHRDGLDFNLAFVDDDFDAEHPKEFDTQYTRALFDYGFRQSRDGYSWKKSPLDSIVESYRSIRVRPGLAVWFESLAHQIGSGTSESPACAISLFWPHRRHIVTDLSVANTSSLRRRPRPLPPSPRHSRPDSDAERPRSRGHSSFRTRICNAATADSGSPFRRSSSGPNPLSPP